MKKDSHQNPVRFRSSVIRIALSVFVVSLVLETGHLRAEEKARMSYPEVGITKSMLFHPSIGYWRGRTGLRLTGMYLNKDHHEFHLNFGYALKDTKRVQHSINLLTSWVAGSDPGADVKYAATGIAYSINYRGIFLEIGLAHPWKDEIGNLKNDPVVPCGYWGYIYRFRPE